MGVVIIILLCVLLLGGGPIGVYSGPYAMHYGGGFGLILLVVLVLFLFGRI